MRIQAFRGNGDLIFTTLRVRVKTHTGGFNDGESVEMLDLFIEVGWPETLRLAFRLGELFR